MVIIPWGRNRPRPRVPAGAAQGGQAPRPDPEPGDGAIRYSRQHKRRTRQRILREARRLFRRHGYDGVGVETIMAAAGLTRGGFYGHFRSKAALFAEALGGDHDLVERLRARPGRSREELLDASLAVLDGYLAPAHRDRVGRGCTLASLAVDAARGAAPARRAYGRALRALSAELARGLSQAEADDARALAAAAVSVGGLMLSRAVGDRELADAISTACRDAAERELRRPRAQSDRASNQLLATSSSKASSMPS